MKSEAYRGYLIITKPGQNPFSAEAGLISIKDPDGEVVGHPNSMSEAKQFIDMRIMLHARR